MEKFYLEKPTIERKNDALEYIKDNIIDFDFVNSKYPNRKYNLDIDLDEKIMKLVRKYQHDIFYASREPDEYKALGEAEDNFLITLKEVIIYGKNEIK